jgi:hypothetical protein
MMSFVRLVFFSVIAVLLLTLVVFAGTSSSTGAIEKAVLFAFGAVVLLCATRVRSLGRTNS